MYIMSICIIIALYACFHINIIYNYVSKVVPTLNYTWPSIELFFNVEKLTLFI
jgi:hypothetical protein